MVEDMNDAAIQLLDLWERYSSLLSESSERQTMTAETDSFLKKLSKLHMIWDHLEKCNNTMEFQQQITKLRETGDRISKIVKIEGNLNAGGKFEWVDSLLVKCLRDGSWLLVDNVNLCSAAVLDRLNALLEPNGVLAIGERGVDENGEIVHIKPHKDFRLFLTMDPRNGEISRAMRNRGVEIYLLNDKEGDEVNELDLKSLISLSGLDHQKYIDVLLKMHSFVSDLILGEKPNVNDLLQTSFLIAQQLSRGISCFDAFFTSISDVYCTTSAHDNFNITNPIEVIRAELLRILHNDQNEEIQEIYHKDITLNTDHLNSDSTMAKIKQQGTVLKQIDDPVSPYCLINYYTITTRDDLSLRTEYIQRFVNPRLASFAQRFQEILNRVDAISNSPLDSQWLPDSNLKSNANAQFLSLYLTIRDEFCELLTTKYVNEKKYLTLYDFMMAIRRGKTPCKMDDIIEKRLLEILDDFHQFVWTILATSDALIDDNLTMEMISALNWYYRVYALLQVNVKKITLNQYQSTLTKLHVHYKWFWKFAVKKLCSSLQTALPSHLASLINLINANSIQTFSIAQKLGKHFRKINDPPPPLVNAKQLMLYAEFEKIEDTLNMYSNTCNFQQVVAMLKQNELRNLLIDTKINLHRDFDVKPPDMIKIEEILKKDGDLVIDVKDFTLLPILDYFSSLYMNKLKQDFDVADEHFLRKSHTVPASSVSSILLYNQTKDSRLKHEAISNIFDYLICKPSNNPSKCLTNTDTFIPTHASTLSFLLMEILVEEKGSLFQIATTTLGNYRKTDHQYRLINSLLWKNVEQISGDDYDFLIFEEKYITSQYEEFLTMLEKMLDITGTVAPLDVERRVEQCVRKILSIYDNCEYENVGSDESTLIELIQKSSYELVRLRHSTRNEKLETISNLYFLLNYLKAFFISRLPLIDPLEKKQLKKQYCEEEVKDLTYLKDSFQLQNLVYSGTDASLHPFVRIVEKRLGKLHDENRKYGEYVAIRPDNISYASIESEIRYYFNALLHPSNILKLFEKCTMPDNPNLELELLQYFCSFQRLIENLKKSRKFYADMIEPLLSNLLGFVYAIRLKIGLCKRFSTEKVYNQLNPFPERMIVPAVQFPILVDEYDHTQDSAHAAIKNGTSFIFNAVFRCGLNDIDNLRYLRCGILETFNLCILDAKYCKQLDLILKDQFCGLIETFVSSWKKQEEALEIKKKEEGSLYKIKHKTEEEEEQEHFQQLFPTFFDQDFSDMQTANLETQPPSDSNNEQQFSGVITFNDLKLVAELHADFSVSCTRSEWLNPGRNYADADHVTPLIDKCMLLKRIIQNWVERFDHTVDKKLMGSLSMLTFVARKFGITKYQNELPVAKSTNNYNFYLDSKPEEVKGCYHILEELRLKINELLQEWPEHPGLQTIKVVLDRIYSFDMTSPISRFLTGLEILLTKCHDWEENAHSGVSISPYIQNLIHQIIEWRKFEMNMWRNSLDSTFQRMNEPIAKWWFYIFDIMNQFLANQFGQNELIETLQKFMETSNLAEFEGRLRLLMTFHCFAVHERGRKNSRVFSNILWNIYQYFRQFIPNVEAKIKELRSPIEKKLKEYIKIVKWKDISYWAVKDTIEKTHKTLHKHIREYEKILQTPVMGCLTNTSAQVKAVESVGIWDRPQRQSPKKYHYTMDPAAYMAKLSLYKKIQDNESDQKAILISRAEKYFHKSRILCKKTILATNYPSLIQHVEKFVTDVIETNSYLQALEVDTTLPKEKQKSQASSFLQQKRKGLADLFKSLATLGLSYRTGIIKSLLENSAQHFLQKPIDLNASFSYLVHSRYDEKLLTIWEGSEFYYTRSLMRLRALELSLRSPAKDLGMQNAERCKGFAAHLMELGKQQKEKLTETSRILYYLRYYTSTITCLSDEKQLIALQTYRKLQDALKNAIIVSEQFKLILDTYPKEFGDELIDIPVLPQVGQIASGRIDSKLESIATATSAIGIIAGKLLNNLDKSSMHVPNTERKLAFSPYISVSKQDVCKDLEALLENISFIRSAFKDIPLVDSFVGLNALVLTLKEKVEESIVYENTVEDNKTEQYAKRLMTKILLVIQKIYAKYENCQPEATDEDTAQEMDFNHSVVTNLFNDLEILNMPEILASSEQLLRVVFRKKLNPSFLAHLHPLLEQIVLLYQYFVTQQLSAYRATCKMSSILLNIFIELATNGFCVPPEFNDEDGASEEQEGGGGGMGLGEGKGENDVSERIESEDQLEDAQPDGKQKNDADNDQDCAEEEKGIEMSEDFDGKMQDVEREDDDDAQSDKDSDADEQMGETGDGADELDERVWGSDDEPEEGENNKEEEKGASGEKEGESQLGAKDEASAQNEDEDTSGKEEQKKEDINEMKEPEYDDEQVDPYHGNQEEYPEPEDMDLPDDLQLDEGAEDKEEPQEENEFDIDKMKEQMPPEEAPVNAEPEAKPAEEKTGPPEDDSEGEADVDEGQKDESAQNDEADEDNENDNAAEDDKEQREKPKSELDEKTPEEQENEECAKAEALDRTRAQDEAEAMDVDNVEASDNVQESITNKQKPNPTEQTIEENNPDDQGTGQSQMEDGKTGQQGKADAQEDRSQNKEEKENLIEIKRKPGESDSQRSLGDVNEPVKKKLKTTDAQQSEEKSDDETENLNEQADMFQHIKDAKTTDYQVLDSATEEQIEQQKEIASENPEVPEQELPPETDDDVEMLENQTQNPEKLEKLDSERKKAEAQHHEGDVTDNVNEIDVEGSVIETSTVPRGSETTHHTQYDIRKKASILSAQELNQLRFEVEQQLGCWNEPPTTADADAAWEKISVVTSSLAQDLSEQLRLVLEPTQASRLKGDYRTGKRINMRKVIPYIASQFRKDKIWLRRTKPSKRDYQIVLAIDDSSSMADNHSKELAFETVALISKSLRLLESGQFGVLSFGESTEIVHKLTEQFNERSGAKLLQKFQFTQKKTFTGKLVNFATEMFNASYSPSSNALITKLLIIVSDGRGIFSEGESIVQQAVRHAVLSNIFMIFVIVDNPENRDSVLDIRMPVFSQGKLLEIKSYMDSFPFPFYIILRDINALPNVLADALRQWFEIVSNLDN